MIGIFPSQFWEMNPREIRVCFTGYAEKEKYRQMAQDRLNHILGQYIAMGVNNPKKYPKEPLLAKAEESKKNLCFTDEDRERQARLRWSKKGKNGKS